MLTLALDTTTRAGSCAVVRDDAVLFEQASDVSRPQAARLPSELMSLLERAKVTLADIDVFAVATGPGSFTGLRIGIASMQGLAFAAGKSLFGVSALDALAHVAGGSTPRVATWVDAWRGEVYAALYERGREIEIPTVAHPEDLLSRFEGRDTLFIGDGADANRALIAAVLGPCGQIARPAVPLLAATIGLMAGDRAHAGQTASPHAISPLYVRRPDAELARDARAGR